MDEMLNNFQKLAHVQKKLKAPKSQYNSFGKYSYRNCEDILEAVKPLLDEVKAVITIHDELVSIGDRYYVKATATFVDYASSCYNPICSTAYAREDESKKGMDGSQITGSASSYARKYALNGLLLIDDTKDADTTNTGATNSGTSSQKAASNSTSSLMTEQHYNILIKACGNAKGISNAEQFWKDRYKVKSLADIPDENFDFILTGMKCDRNGNYIGSR